MHAIRSGHSPYWLILPFSFPLLGSVVYFLAIYFPEVRHSRGGRQVVRHARSHNAAWLERTKVALKGY